MADAGTAEQRVAGGEREIELAEIQILKTLQVVDERLAAPDDQSARDLETLGRWRDLLQLAYAETQLVKNHTTFHRLLELPDRWVETAFTALRTYTGDIEVYLTKDRDHATPRQLTETLLDHVEILAHTLLALVETPGPLPPETSPVYADVMNQAARARQAFERDLAIEARRRAEADAAVVREQRDASTAAAATIGSTAEWTEFQSLAAAERTKATRFRVATIAFLGAAVVYAAVVVFWYHDADDQEFLRKAALTLPAIVLAGYLGREAAEHRKVARWAQAISVQLSTMSAFVAELPAEQRQAVTLLLASRVFGQAPGEKGAGPVLVPASMQGLVPGESGSAS